MILATALLSSKRIDIDWGAVIIVWPYNMSFVYSLNCYYNQISNCLKAELVVMFVRGPRRQQIWSGD